MDKKIRYEISIHGKQNIVGEVVLKHCPFCGSNDLALFNTHTASCWVECNSCRGEAHGVVFQTRTGRQNKKHFLLAVSAAVEAWNTRWS